MDAEQTYTLLENYANGGQVHVVILAAAFLVASAVIAHLSTKLIRRVTQLDGVPLPSSSILVNIARIAIWGVGLGLMLSICFDVDVNAIIAALGVGGIAVSLGLQDTIKNFIGGLQVTLMKVVAPGDHIVVGSIDGIVHDVSWRQTVVQDYEGIMHIIPNSVINSTTIGRMEPPTVVASTVVLSNDGRDLDELIHEIERHAKEAVEAIAPLEKDPWLLVTQIGEYGIWCKMRFILVEPDHAREARDAALRAAAPYTRRNAEEVLGERESELERL